MNYLTVNVKVDGSPDGKYIYSRIIEYPLGTLSPDVSLIERALRILYSNLSVSISFTFTGYSSEKI